ncbi:cupin domain-containing protein [Candidatus Electronema sp. JM]|uniref:cupin domain-containing protein n=1 Tax=Candidatus Electronema sp. JM TaxID=3401571 RepID=UPI003AA9A2B7
MSNEAKLMRLTELAAYQEGAVISKTLLSKLTGTVTLFAFDKDQGLSEHTAPFDAMVQLLDGEADITVGGQLFQLRQGDMLIMPAQVPHALHAVTPFKMLLTMIRS